MKLDFFDINAFIGLPMKSSGLAMPDAAALMRDLNRAGISRAVAWHIAQHDYDALEGNRMIAEAAAGAESVYACWSVLPPVTGEVVGEGFFDEMKQNRVVALRAFPEQSRFMLNRTAFGPFLDEVSERGIPFLVSPERGVSWQAINELMRDYPELTCVVCDIGVWGMDRQTWPLLDSYPNLRIETSMLSLQAGGVEETVKRFGASRLLFGTGVPTRYAEAAVLQLTHADIPDADKRLIASGNLDALVREVLA